MHILHTVLFTSKFLYVSQKEQTSFQDQKILSHNFYFYFTFFNIHVGSLSSAEFPVWKFGREYSDRDHVIFQALIHLFNFYSF
jgi:hypothetical protein